MCYAAIYKLKSYLHCSKIYPILISPEYKIVFQDRITPV
ncbi:unnamed protein product [Acanthoscelides obtectus]|uniref:Uncharacterized protein n=1 Tax=Acanthoscelides obtectus TaxID=200917 RepID=A0A9P0K2A0_ACAOB|nr:unnamed protein product [Acanthoscelides obtectus]CAK1623798.1 hypothetical protein AOBTE_LOCUS2192 [Acanthoscelides obtectus]